jgi:hypothetical protein
LTKDQTVRVTANVLTNGTLLATQVALFEKPDQTALQGLVTGLGTATCPSSGGIAGNFQVTLLDGQLKDTVLAANAAIGVVVNVAVTASTDYEIDYDGITQTQLTNLGLQFKGLCDLAIGQTVQVRGLSPNATPAANSITVSSDRVRLIDSAVTGTVKSVSSTTFVLTGLPPLLGGTNGTVTVQTLATTKFCTASSTAVSCQSGVSGLAVNDKVSAGGLLFNTASTPTLLAQGAFKRQ